VSDGVHAPDLTEAEVFQIIDLIEEFDPLVVGGQALNIWVAYYRAIDPDFLPEDWPLTSKDIDFYRNREAAEALADHLGGRVLVPALSDMVPNAAVVIGDLNDRQIRIDFMSTILGVKSPEMNAVMIEATAPITNRVVRLVLLNPVDCLRSRLANINTLGRHDEHTVRQAEAAIEVVIAFLDELLDDPNHSRRVQDALRDVSHIIKDQHRGKASHTKHGLTPDRILEAFQNDSRLDDRWRSLTLAKAIARARRGLATGPS
jgi:hypothetical protein